MRSIIAAAVLAAAQAANGQSVPNGGNVPYVGAVAINPCQDPKILADWYAELGFETSMFATTARSA